MAFQWIIDKAESISIDKKKMIGITETRSGVIRAVSRGIQPVRLTVKYPDGPRWSDISTDIASATALDRYQTAVITIPYSRFPWYYNNVQPAQNESYTVLCVQFPEWTIFARNQVSWAGPFVFQQYIA
jgi:hypothetical protein